jgi:MFS family permease
MIPTVFASAYTVFPRSKFYIVGPIIGLVATLAPTIGPTIGGYITDLMSWHWLFFINIVPGIAIARPLTSNGWDSVTGVPVGQETILVIPWLSLLVVGLLVPLVAGAIAWAGIRKAPQVTRRTT